MSALGFPDNYWRLVANRYRLWFGNILTLKQSLRVAVCAIILIVFGLVPGLPEGVYLRLVLSAEWCFVGVPLFTLIFAPIEVYWARALAKIDVLFPIILASFLTSLIIVFANYSFDFAFAHFDMPLWQRVAVATFICSLVAGLVFSYGVRELDDPWLSDHPVLTTMGAASRAKALQSPLLRSLPASKRGVILELTAADKHTEIRTEAGSHMVRIPLREATDKLQSHHGALVHRSHWLAFQEMDALFYEGGNPRLRLINGEVRPVSRKAIPGIKTALKID